METIEKIQINIKQNLENWKNYADEVLDDLKDGKI